MLATKKAAGIGGGGVFFGLFVPGKLLSAEEWGFNEFFNLPIFRCPPLKGEKRNLKISPPRSQKKSCQKVEQKTSVPGVPPAPLLGPNLGGVGGNCPLPPCDLSVPSIICCLFRGISTDVAPWGPARSFPVAAAGSGLRGSPAGVPHPRTDVMIPVDPGVVVEWGGGLCTPGVPPSVPRAPGGDPGSCAPLAAAPHGGDRGTGHPTGDTEGWGACGGTPQGGDRGMGHMLRGTSWGGEGRGTPRKGQRDREHSGVTPQKAPPKGMGDTCQGEASWGGWVLEEHPGVTPTGAYGWWGAG